MRTWNDVDLGPLTLTSPRLTLRPWHETDTEAVLAGVTGDPWMREFLPVPDPYTRRDAHEFVTDLGHEGRFVGTGFGGALVETSSGRPIGGFGLRLPIGRHGHCEIGYSVWSVGRGHGYAVEASDTLARWAFAHEIDRIEIHCSVRNIASAKTALAAGFAYEGIRRQQIPVRDWVDDGALFARLASDAGTPIRPVLPTLGPNGLTDGTVTLRVSTREDAPALLEELADPISQSWAFNDRAPVPDEVVATAASAGLLWLVGPIGRMTIVDTATARPAGSIQLRIGGPSQVGSIGYAVHPGFRGRGYTTRALRLLVTWAFREAGFVRLELGAKVANIASQTAARRAGFEAEGVRAARLRNPDGTFSDEACFAIHAER